MPEMEPRYDHTKEGDIYKAWEASGYFDPDKCVEDGVTPADAEPYSIVLPPPNVTGTLHMGHAAMLAIEDILVRYHRMKGRRTLWVPGTDSAAVATQAKVETEVYKKEGKTRYDLGREELLQRIERFTDESKATILNQVKTMGSSLDWSRYAYTMDEARYGAVMEAFKRMFEGGLIYRGDRIVNWDPKLQTTISDDEIEYAEEKSPFYYLQYGPFVIGTARPETKFGDKYVVMHPDDERYAEYSHGQKIELEWINGPTVATVVKDPAIDMAFGTGVMTITPWHDATDFEIAERHKLEKEQIIDRHGKLLPIAGEFAGLHIKKARPLIVERLKEKGLIVKVEEGYTHNVATNSRGGGVIEPQIMRQWFVDVDKEFALPHSRIDGIPPGSKTTLKQLMHTAVESGQIKIMPERFEKTYFHWIENLRDWCISRQIWYGHRIPVWYCLHCGKFQVAPAHVSRWYLVRHGETDWNVEGRSQGHSGTALNEKGRAQAAEAARKLKGLGIDLILASDLPRAQETARIISEELGGVAVIHDEHLRERFYGQAEGRIAQEARQEFADLYEYEGKSAGQESYAEAEERMWQAFLRHKEAHPKKHIAIVSHGGALRAVLRRIKNITPEQALSAPTIPNAEVIPIDVLDPCASCGHRFFEQDPDTLDTWFSSGLWTFSTLGWPKDSEDLKLYHPTSLLETGYDIIFFWVARMILMTGYLLGDVPFRQVYLHGLVRDDKGRKMSKSLGNIIDPLDLVSKYGADATRLSLVIGTAPGNDLKLSEDRVRGYRNFSTKLWNIARFVTKYADAASPSPELSEEDTKNLAELAEVKRQVSAALDSLELHLAAETLYHYAWHTFADKIIEAAKPRLQGEDPKAKAAAYHTLRTILDECLVMLHPFMPFVTESIYQTIEPPAHAEGPKERPKLLMVKRWA